MYYILANTTVIQAASVVMDHVSQNSRYLWSSLTRTSALII